MVPFQSHPEVASIPRLILRARELELDGARKRLDSHDFEVCRSCPRDERQYLYFSTSKARKLRTWLSLPRDERVAGIELDAFGGIQRLPLYVRGPLPPAPQDQEASSH